MTDVVDIKLREEVALIFSKPRPYKKESKGLVT